MNLFVDIRKRLGSFTLNASFETADAVTGLLGASGCGKSMTLKCIAGVEKPDEGWIVLDGETLFDSARGINLPPQKRQVGYLFQHYALFPHMTVEKNILCGLHAEKDKATRQRCLRETLEMLQLTGLEKHRPAQLSGGQAQRAALARMLVSQPRLLLLDEPSLGLAPIIIQQIFDTIEQLRKEGMTIFLVEQNANQALKLADRGYVLENGRVVLEDTGDALLANEAVRSAYLGG